LLADDHWAVRAGLHALLDREANLRVVGEAATGEGASSRPGLKPDVVLMTSSCRHRRPRAVRRIAASMPARRFSCDGYLQEDRLLDVLAAGAKGFVSKGSPPRTYARDPHRGTQRSLSSIRARPAASSTSSSRAQKGKVP